MGVNVGIRRFTPSESQLQNSPFLLILAATVCLLAYFTGPITADVSGQFWLARAMRRGAHLYTDFVELNPPLWFWMAVPIDWFAETTGLRTQPITIIAVAGLAMASIQASARLLPPLESRTRTAFLSYMALVFMLMPWRHLEQREHLVLLAAVPYLVLACARRQDREVSPIFAAGIGIFGAVGFALKPFFLTVPLLVEIWLLLSLKSRWRPFRAELLALVLTGLAYAAAIAAFTPLYFTQVPLLFPAYSAASPSFFMFFDILPFIWLLVVWGIRAHRRELDAGKTSLSTAFLVGGAGFAIAYTAQQKGWLYHGIPTTGCIALALAASLIELGKPKGRVRLFIPGLLVWPLCLSIPKTEATWRPDTEIAPVIADLKPGDAFGLISTIGATSWPATVDRGLRTSSRHGQYWMLPALDAHPDSDWIRKYAHQAASETAFDYRCLPPQVIIFPRFDRPFRYKNYADDPYRFFIQNPDFAAVLSHYQLTRRHGIFDVYRQARPLPRPAGHLCRHPG